MKEEEWRNEKGYRRICGFFGIYGYLHFDFQKCVRLQASCGKHLRAGSEIHRA